MKHSLIISVFLILCVNCLGQKRIDFINSKTFNLDSTISIVSFSEKTIENPEFPKIASLNLNYRHETLKDKPYYQNIYFVLRNLKIDTIFCNNTIFSNNANYFACLSCEENQAQIVTKKGAYSDVIIMDFENPEWTKTRAFLYTTDNKKKLFDLNYVTEYYEKIHGNYHPFQQTSFVISNSGLVIQSDNKNGSLKLFDNIGNLIVDKQFYPKVMPDSNGEFNSKFSLSSNRFLVTLYDNQKESFYKFLGDSSKSFKKNIFSRAFCFNKEGVVEWEYVPSPPFQLYKYVELSNYGKYSLIYSVSDKNNSSQLVLLDQSGKLIKTFPMYFDGTFSIDEQFAIIRGVKNESIIECKTGKLLYNTDSLVNISSIDISGMSNRVAFISGNLEYQKSGNPNITNNSFTNIKLKIVDFITKELLWSQNIPDNKGEDHSPYPVVKISENGKKVLLINHSRLSIFEQIK